MQHPFKVIERAWMARLPVQATADDVREVVQLLKKTPEGITIIEASDAIRKRLFDPRKIAAYESWGIISNDGDRMRLTQLGREFSDALGPEAQIYRVMLDNTPPYRSALEWIHEQNLELVTYADIVEYWRDQFPDALPRDEKTCEGQVASFLHLCQAAEIGMATLGRKGQPSRLRVDRKELAAYVQNRVDGISAEATATQPRTESQRFSIVPTSRERRRVLVSAVKGLGIIDCIRDAFQVADIECDVVERNPIGEEFVAPHIYEAMHRCNAGIVVISDSEVANGSLNQTVFIEVGAALVHFARRVIVLCERNVSIPLVNGFCWLDYEGDRLTWETGMRLVKTVKGF